MKLNPAFKLRSIAGENIIVNQGTPDADLTRIISLNASATLLWERLQGKDFTVEDAAAALADAYHIPAGQAAEDAARWVEAMKDCQVLQDSHEG